MKEETELEKVKRELAVTDELLNDRQRVIDAIPDCPIHGSNCVPHALEWVEKKKKEQAMSDNLLSACDDYIDGINMDCAKCGQPKYLH